MNKVSKWWSLFDRPLLSLLGAGLLLWTGIEIHRDGGWIGFTIFFSIWPVVPILDLLRTVRRVRGKARSVAQDDTSA